MASFVRLKKNILDENPVFVQALALCPAIAITTGTMYGIGMGLATMLVLLATCFVASLLRKLVPENLRFPCFILLSVTFTTVAGMLLEVFFPALHSALGIFVPLIALNCIMLSKIENFATDKSLGSGIIDALGMGLGFTLALTILSLLREIISFGTVLGFSVLPDAFPGFLLAALPAGGFLTLGFVAAGLTALRRKIQA